MLSWRKAVERGRVGHKASSRQTGISNLWASSRHGTFALAPCAGEVARTVPDPNPPLPPRVHHAHAGGGRPTPGEGVVGRVRHLRGSYGAPGREGDQMAGRRSGRGHVAPRLGPQFFKLPPPRPQLEMKDASESDQCHFEAVIIHWALVPQRS
jgi:hypothetical protein